MPTTLPVPSKGALRTLRHLALGASCTAVFSTAAMLAVLTEERRRQLRYFDKLHENAKKIKSARNYHGGGATIMEDFERLGGFGEGESWLPSNVVRIKVHKRTELRKDSQNAEGREIDPLPFLAPTSENVPWQSIQPGRMERERVPVKKSLPHPKSQSREKFRKTTQSTRIDQIFMSRFQRHEKMEPTTLKQTSTSRQLRLARDVTTLSDQAPNNLDAAVLRFLDAMEEGITEDGSELLPELIDTAIRLSTACRTHNRNEFCDRILGQVCRYGTMREEDYHRFEPADTISRLLGSSTTNCQIDMKNLKQAAGIYLTKFKERPQTMPDSLLDVGEILCRHAYLAGFYSLTVDLHFHLFSLKHSRTPNTTQYLIKAAHAKGQHKRVIRYFQKFFDVTAHTTEEFHCIIGLVVESAVSIGDFEGAEKQLDVAAQRTKPPIKWFSMLLGKHWRTFRDITKTRELFDRLEPLASSAVRPQALYTAMIQCHVEAKEESVAASLFDRMQSLYQLDEKDLRIYGHFALAKALREDWLGVREELSKIGVQNARALETLSDCFVPILKNYSKCHSITETEDFIRSYVVECKLVLNAYIVNLMIDAYGKAKEINSLERWISYTASQGFFIGAVAFNSLLNNLFSWGCSYGQIFDFYQRIKNIDGAAQMVMDKSTVLLLRRLATVNTEDPYIVEQRLRRINRMKTSPNTLDPFSIHSQMVTALGKGDWFGTLETYRHALAREISLEPKHLFCAVRASLKLYPQDIAVTTGLIKDARTKDIDIRSSVSAVFIHQLTGAINSGEGDADTIISLTETTITIFKDANLEIASSVLTHAASGLQRAGYYQQAIDVWNTMARRLDLKASSFDLAALTVLCQAYAALFNSNGVRWVLKVIDTQNLVPDRKFVSVLKELQRQAIKSIDRGHCTTEMSQFLETIIDARKQVQKFRMRDVSTKLDVQKQAAQMIERAIQEQVRYKSGLSTESLGDTDTRALKPSLTVHTNVLDVQNDGDLEEQNASLCGETRSISAAAQS